MLHPGQEYCPGYRDLKLGPGESEIASLRPPLQWVVDVSVGATAKIVGKAVPGIFMKTAPRPGGSECVQAEFEPHAFVAAKSFDGARVGNEFKTGSQGLGYYRGRDVSAGDELPRSVPTHGHVCGSVDIVARDMEPEPESYLR